MSGFYQGTTDHRSHTHAHTQSPKWLQKSDNEWVRFSVRKIQGMKKRKNVGAWESHYESIFSTSIEAWALLTTESQTRTQALITSDQIWFQSPFWYSCHILHYFPLFPYTWSQTRTSFLQPMRLHPIKLAGAHLSKWVEGADGVPATVITPTWNLACLQQHLTPFKLAEFIRYPPVWATGRQPVIMWTQAQSIYI